MSNLQQPLLDNGQWRIESDSLGTAKVPAAHLWGAQTQRSLIHFSIGDDRMPKEVYHAYGYVKKAAAIVNARLGHLPQDEADLIATVADELIAGSLDAAFCIAGFVAGCTAGALLEMHVGFAAMALPVALATLAVFLGDLEPTRSGTMA